MKYKAIQQLKTKRKVLGVFDSLDEAVNEITGKGGRFNNLSYVGGFPTFINEKRQMFSVQGMVDGLNIVCSLNKKELEKAGFCS